MERAVVRLSACLVCAVCLTQMAPDALAAKSAPASASVSHAALFGLYYQFEVAGYCGLISDDVGRGFRAKAEPLEAASGLDREGLNRLRGKAWQAAHEEWQNRGLGGFKRWCRNEGARSARRLAG